MPTVSALKSAKPHPSRTAASASSERPLEPPEVLEAQERRRVRNLPLGIAREDAVVADLKSGGPVALELIIEAQRDLEARRGLGVVPRQMVAGREDSGVGDPLGHVER